MILEILYANKIVKYKISWIHAHTITGDISVYPHHEPLIVPLKNNQPLIIHSKKNVQESINLRNGIMEILPNKIVVITRMAYEKTDWPNS